MFFQSYNVKCTATFFFGSQYTTTRIFSSAYDQHVINFLRHRVGLPSGVPTLLVVVVNRLQHEATEDSKGWAQKIGTPFLCALTLPNINRLLGQIVRVPGQFSDSIITNFLLILTMK